MAKKVLVTYTTKYGSTREVAESIGRFLKEKYFDVEILLMKEVNDLGDYDAVIIGAPLYAGSLLPDTGKFFTRFQSVLEKIPSALFILGPLNDTPDEIRGAQVQLDANMKKFAWYRPASQKLFAGALRLEKLRFPDSLIKLYRSSKEKPMRSSDNRDWKAIQAWASTLPAELHLKTTEKDQA